MQAVPPYTHTHAETDIYFTAYSKNIAQYTEVYSKPCQTPIVEPFCKKTVEEATC